MKRPRFSYSTFQNIFRAKDGVLTLNTGITFGGKDKKTFAYDDNTVFVVVELKANGDVDLLRTARYL